MKKIVWSLLALCSNFAVQAQSIDKIINVKKVTEVEKILAADDMEGRRAFTSGIDKASNFIESEFKKIGLQTFNGAKDYKQAFFMTESQRKLATVIIDGNAINTNLNFHFQILKIWK